MYYNPITEQQKSLYELRTLLNASIPDNVEEINNEWYLIHQDNEPMYNTNREKLVLGTIYKNNDNKYYQQWNIINKSEEEIQLENIPTEKERIEALESALLELVLNK